MKTKAVYALVSRETDYYMEQMLLSIASLHVHNPGMEVIVLTDQDTEKRLAGTGIPEYVEIKSVEIPDSYGQMQKSRFLKTKMRSLMKGPFLYLDTDTIVCGALDSLDSLDADIAMVADCNASLPLTSIDATERCKNAGFDNMQGFPFFNCGVIWATDSPASKSLFEKWNSRWLESVGNGVSYDQPALCRANADCGFIIKEISGSYNWQIAMGSRLFIDNSCIIHYYQFGLGRYIIPQYIRSNGIDPLIMKIAKASPTKLFYLFTLTGERLSDYLLSDMLGIFGDYPEYYLSVSVMARILHKPYIWLSRLKALFKRH